MIIKKENLIELPFHVNDRGRLVAIEGENNVPFSIQRVFSVSAQVGEIRGDHAHKKCSQFMVCVSGVIEIICDNGIEETIYQLDSPSIGVNVEPGIWAKEKYLTENAVLMVLCDMPYENEDYIRDYNEFIIYKKSKMEKK